MNNLKIALKFWSSNNSNILKKINDLHKKGFVDFIELYVVPDTLKTFEFENVNIPVIIHAPHDFHGVNIADEDKYGDNIQKLKECFKFADKLNSKYIILHPGIIIGKKTDYSKKFLDTLKDRRIVIENMPKKAIGGGVCVGYKEEEIKNFIDMGFGFCLDFAHAIKSAVSQKKDYKVFVKKLIELKPCILHLCNGFISEVDDHLNLWEGEFDMHFIKDCIKKSESEILVFEIPKDGETVDNDINNIEWFKKI